MTVRLPPIGHDAMAAALRVCARCHRPGSDDAPLIIEAAAFTHRRCPKVAPSPARTSDAGERFRNPHTATHEPSTSTRADVAERAADHDAECQL